MEGSDCSAWVFDSLVGFLHGPVWNIPLQTFIEEKSLPFEPTDNGEVLDRPEYKQIHDEYKNLVDVMLGSFMDDIGISADQFEAACKMSAQDLAGLPAQFHRRLFEQIWAANDYDIFVKMMTHKNVELQLQALDLIERRFGTLPNIFASYSEELDTSRSDESEDWSDKEDVLTELKKLQLDETDEDVTANVPPSPAEVVAEKQNKQSILSKLQTFDMKEAERGVHVPSHAPDKKAAPVYPPALPPKKVEVSEAEVLARQHYLTQQRDKLLAVKKQVRGRRLGAAAAAAAAAEADPPQGAGGGDDGAPAPPPAPPRARPRSARAAAAALAGAPPPPPPPDAMQLRRALASKLKTDVVDKGPEAVLNC